MAGRVYIRPRRRGRSPRLQIPLRHPRPGRPLPASSASIRSNSRSPSTKLPRVAAGQPSPICSSILLCAADGDPVSRIEELQSLAKHLRWRIRSARTATCSERAFRVTGVYRNINSGDGIRVPTSIARPRAFHNAGTRQRPASTFRAAISTFSNTISGLTC
jgi:hypothetical protein